MVNSSEILFRLALAAVLGGLVGLEREVHGRPAGIRTYLLLSMGSALIMVLSEFLFLDFVPLKVGEAMRADPGRIAAQAVTGIGFLGGGVILRYRDSIRGLTTAACVWVACAIGLTIGAGSSNNSVNIQSTNLWNFGGGAITVGSAAGASAAKA